MYEFTNRKTGERLECDFVMVDPLKPETIEQFAACLRDEYGETYPRQSVYVPEAFAEEIKSGTVTAILAVSGQGDVVSSLALTPCGGLKSVPEMTMHVVRKAYRGFGVGTVLTKELLQRPEAKACCAVAAHSVTFHPKAQHQTLSCGLVPTGFIFNVHSNDILKHTFPVEGVRKQSLAVSIFPEKKRNAGTLYVPMEHRDFISGVYKRLGADFDFAVGGPEEDMSRFHTHQDETHKTFTAEFFSCGRDIAKVVKGQMETFSSPLQTINLLIDMNCPGASWAYESLRELGFIFTGLHPLCENGEFLIMHHPLALEIPFDKLCTDEGYRETLEYIRERA